MAGRREARARGGQPDARAALERYQLHGIRETGEELGRGSYAAVIEVDFKGMRCAAKKIYSVLAQRGEEDRLVARFEEECRLLGTLRHPHIVQFLGIYFDPATDLPVLVMEFLPATLAQCVERYGRLPAEISYAILRDVALGLRYLHEQRPRVIHRDLSANNVLLTGDMTAKISDLGVAKILQISPAEMSRMTQTPGTQSYMSPEALRPNPCYDVEMDVFSYGVMLVHMLSGQWPFPSEATQVDPYNPAHVIGLSEVERRAQYLNIIGHPSEEQEGHPLMPLIERCLNNSPDLRPTSSELVERMSDAVTQQPLTFSNRVDMMQRMESILTEKETLQTRVSVLEGRVERGEVAQREQREESQRQAAALSVEVEQLRLQVGNLKAERTYLSTVATAREELHRTEMQAKERQLQECLDAKVRQHQAEVATRELQHQADLRQLQGRLDVMERQHQTEMAVKDEAEVKRRDDQLQAKSTELSSQSSLLSQERSTIEGLHLQLHQARQHLTSGTQVSKFIYSTIPYSCVTITKLMIVSLFFQVKPFSILACLFFFGVMLVHILSGPWPFPSEATRIDWLMSFSQAHVIPPNTNLVWRECASMPVELVVARIKVINGIVYVGGGFADGDDKYLVCTYNPMKDEWSTLPPAPVRRFGVGRLDGKLVVVGGMYRDEEVTTGDVHVFEEDTQQWVRSIPPMPTGLFDSVVATHSSSLVVCGAPDVSSPASMFVYSSHSSRWHSRSPPPLTFISFLSSAVVVNDTYYIAVGSEGAWKPGSCLASAAVFSIPLSTLLDPNAPQDPSTWQRIPDTPCHMSNLAATGGCLLALGGLRNACDFESDEELASNISTTVHAYCPATSSWVRIGDLPGLWLTPAITTLSSGELFIAGVSLNNKAFIGTIN